MEYRETKKDMFRRIERLNKIIEQRKANGKPVKLLEKSKQKLLDEFNNYGPKFPRGSSMYGTELRDL